MNAFFKQLIIAVLILILAATVFFFNEHWSIIVSHKLDSPFATYTISTIYTFAFGIWIYIPYTVGFLLTKKFFLYRKSSSINFAVYGFLLSIVYLTIFELAGFFVLSPTHLTRSIQLSDFSILIYSPLGIVYGYLYYIFQKQ